MWLPISRSMPIARPCSHIVLLMCDTSTFCPTPWLSLAHSADSIPRQRMMPPIWSEGAPLTEMGCFAHGGVADIISPARACPHASREGIIASGPFVPKPDADAYISLGLISFSVS